jgi:glucose/arabinose dehydrogenase
VPALKLTQVASGLSSPVLVKSAPGDTSRLFVVQQGGLIRIVQNGQVLGTPFLNVSSLIASGGEQGLLGLAFHPNYAQNGRFFIHYSDNSGGDTVIAEYARSANANVASPNAVGTVLTQDQPFDNHNGGSIEFGGDGMLYVALGDGGDGGDPLNNAQNVNTLLGKILRLDVTSLPVMPAGNYPGALPEIWDIGMRNPWRVSFDPCTGDLYIGDVGQSIREEVDFEPAQSGHKNYGWRLKEGKICYNPSSNCDPASSTTAPVLDYDHGSGCAIAGGYVYRGSSIPGLRGSYLFGDYCSGRIWRTTVSGGTASAPVELTNDLGSGGLNISSFGQDAAGEVYVVDHNGAIYRIDAE